MSWMLDAYNVIGRGRALGLSLAVEGKEKLLLDLVARWRDRQGVREGVRVVFDGQYGLLAHGRPRYTHRGIEVEYSLDRSADEAILRRVGRERRPRELKVVTSDARVAREARLHGARVLSSEEFLDLVRTSLAAGDAEKPESPGAEDVAEWLRIFSGDTDP